MMEKLYKTYKETGGILNEEQEQQIDLTKMTAYDATKVLLVKKIEAIRQQLHHRDEISSIPHQGRTTVTIQLDQKIRNMLRYIKNDFEKLSKIVQTEHTRRHQGQTSKEYIESQQMKEIDLDLIEKHIEEVEAMFKRRKSSIENGPTDKQSGNSNEEVALIFSSQLPNDPLDSSFPSIDVSKSLENVKKNNQRIEETLDIFSGKVSALKDVIIDTGYELYSQNKIQSNIEMKNSTETTAIERLNLRATSVRDGVNITLRITIAFICITILLTLIAVFILFIVTIF